MRYIDKIKSPKQLKKLDIKQLEILSKEIQGFLVESISKTGGHLASNLGVVELSIALHYCFNSPTDKIIWDVGHQAYVHKILTGRKDQFNTLRKLNGLSGFPKQNESKHDVFDTGHSSTSISAALGYCVSRDLNNESNKVIAIIGDGSMTGGMAYEALNNAGRSNRNIIVILNDNQMSISKNVGAMSQYLNNIRTAPEYLDAKKDVHKILKKVPLVGIKVDKAVEKTKDSIKSLLVEGSWFEEIGFTYVGLVDGNNIKELINVMKKISKMQGPILVHIRTKKGNGYRLAEEFPDRFHGVSQFELSTGKALEKNTGLTYSEVFGNEMCKIAKNNEKIVAITAAMASGTGLSKFYEKYPERLIDVGIAEAHAVTFASGMAKNGHIPVFAVYSTFLQRAYDQILHDVCIQNLHVIFAIDRAGIVGNDGETHQGIYDIAFLSHIPNLTLIAPRNKIELEKMLQFAVEFNGPIGIRYPKGNVSTINVESNENIEYGKSEVIKKGKNIAIISVGTIINTVYNVYDRLVEKGYEPTIIDAKFISPIDAEMVKNLQEYEYVFSVEDHIRHGGFGTILNNELLKYNIKTDLTIISFPDEFINQGSQNELLSLNGLDDNGIYNTIMNKIKP